MRRLVDEVFDVATFFFALLELKNNSVAFFRQQNKLQYLFVFFQVDEEGEITSVRGCGQIFQNVAVFFAVFVKRSPDNSCVVSVFLVLLVDPVLAVRCLIVYLAVQFIENQFIYPRVVGKSVGLSPLYTLVAAMIGGELFGIIGIIFFIPLTAVIIELVKEDACRRIQAREPQRSGPSEQ